MYHNPWTYIDPGALGTPWQMHHNQQARSIDQIVATVYAAKDVHTFMDCVFSYINLMYLVCLVPISPTCVLLPLFHQLLWRLGKVFYHLNMINKMI